MSVLSFINSPDEIGFDVEQTPVHIRCRRPLPIKPGEPLNHTQMAWGLKCVACGSVLAESDTKGNVQALLRERYPQAHF